MFQECCVLFQSISYCGNITDNVECHNYERKKSVYLNTYILSISPLWLYKIYWKILTIALILKRLGYSQRTIKHLIPRTRPLDYRVSMHMLFHNKEFRSPLYFLDIFKSQPCLPFSDVRPPTRPTPRSLLSIGCNSGFSFPLKPSKSRLRDRRKILATIERPTLRGSLLQLHHPSGKSFSVVGMTVSELFWLENSFDYAV